jgi:pimeloyl-ACP methyl ester carboxylesterase
MARYGDDPDREALTPGEITALWRQIGALRKRGAAEKGPLFDQLGVDADTQRLIDELLDRLGDIGIVEPGLVLDEAGCDLGWQPSVLAPSFYGFSDLGTADGLPGRVRVFFPSIDGSPQNASILTGCGGYPLVAFLHGQCNDAEHYRAWDLVPIQLARSGYVVAVPELSSTPPFGGDTNPDIGLVEQTLLWMRTSWAHNASLMPRPMTAIVGHSWGALLGAVVARRLLPQSSVSAYASLSGGWLEWPSSPPRPLPSLNMATMFMWGTGSSDLFARLEGGAASIWEEAPGAAHKVEFRDGEHWDYFREGATNCGAFWRGPCPLMRPLAADFLTTFLSHYMAPEKWQFLNGTIPHSLIPPPLDLTPQQEFFAGGHLQGLSQIASAPECSVTHTWRLPPFGSGSVTLGSP